MKKDEDYIPTLPIKTWKEGEKVTTEQAIKAFNGEVTGEWLELAKVVAPGKPTIYYVNGTKTTNE